MEALLSVLTPVGRGVALQPLGLAGEGELTAAPNLVDGLLEVGVGPVALVTENVLHATLSIYPRQQHRKVLSGIAGAVKARDVEANGLQLLRIVGSQNGDVVAVIYKSRLAHIAGAWLFFA